MVIRHTLKPEFMRKYFSTLSPLQRNPSYRFPAYRRTRISSTRKSHFLERPADASSETGTTQFAFYRKVPSSPATSESNLTDPPIEASDEATTTPFPSYRTVPIPSTTMESQFPERPTEASSEALPTQEILAIEAPPSTTDETTQIHVDGAPVKLDAMGPIVINADGTISRVNNWHEMTENEQALTRRLLIKRNAIRRKELIERGVGVGGSVGTKES